MAVLHHAKHQKASLVCSCLKPLDRSCIQAHGFFQNHMTTRIDGLTRQFNVASIGGRNRNDIHIMNFQGLGNEVCAVRPPPTIRLSRGHRDPRLPSVVHHRDESGLRRCLNHGSMALADVTASNHRKFDRRLHTPKVAD